MAGQQLAEVCAVLVEEHYGELPAQIFSTLAEHGRITFPNLAQATKLPPRYLRHSLAVLIQQHLILHSTQPDDETAFYSVDWRNAYGLVRFGKFTQIVGERHGEDASQIMENLLQLGHARVGDLVDAYDLAPGSKRDSGVEHGNGNGQINGDGPNGHHKDQPNGISHGKITTVSQLHTALRTLLNARFLVKVGKRAFQPDADMEEEIEEIVMEKEFPDRKVGGPKKQQAFKRSVRGLKRTWRDDEEYNEKRDLASNGTINRGVYGAQQNNKRMKMSNGSTNYITNGFDSDTGVKLSNDLVVRVNLDKCVVALRSQRLEQYASRYLGETTGAVYGALLRALEQSIKSVRDESQEFQDEDEEEDAQPMASVDEVTRLVDPELELASSIQGAKSHMPNGTGKTKRGNSIFIEEDEDLAPVKDESESEEDEAPNGLGAYQDKSKRMGLIEKHLNLLQEHQQQFCRRVGVSGGGQYRVNFPALTNTLINAEIDTTVTSRFGKPGVRLVRMLRDKGKLEEKGAASCALMRVKDVRIVLAELQAEGFVDWQELPKDNARQPGRTLFLWNFDQKKTQQMLLHQSYQGIARCLQRLKAERTNYLPVIEKAERLAGQNVTSENFGDAKKLIIGREGRLEEESMKLSGMERQHLRSWRETEERLLAQVGRLDEMVALLRDFGGKDVSMVT